MVRADSLTPADILGVLWRYGLGALLLAIASAAGVYTYSLSLPNQFTATTLVLVEGDAFGTDYVRTSVTVDLEARLRTLREKVLSRTNLQTVMDRFGLETDAPSWEVRLQNMRDRIDIEVTRSDAFTIAFTNRDPDVARDVTNVLAQLFIDDSRGAIVRQSQGATALLDQRLDQIGADLQVREKQIADFKAQHRGSLPEHVTGSSTALESAKTQLGTVTADLAAARERRTRLERLSVPNTGAMSSPGARQLAQQLLSLASTESIEERVSSQPAVVRLEVRRLQRESLLQRFTAMHPDVRQMDAEIASLEAEAARTATDPVAEVVVAGALPLTDDLADTQRQIAQLELRRAELQVQIADYEARLTVAPRVEQELRDLERQYEGLVAEYRDLRDRRGDAALTADTMSTERDAGFKVIDPAVTPERKSGPQRAVYLLAGALIGLALAYGTAFAYEMVAQPLHGPGEIERFLGVPVLSVIPQVQAPARARSWGGLRLSALVLGTAAATITLLRLLV